MAVLSATCATLVSLLGSAPAGTTVRLPPSARCEAIQVRAPVAPKLRLEIPPGAHVASLRFMRGSASGLTVTGGGSLGSPDHKFGFEAREAVGLTLENLTVTGSTIGVALGGGRDLTLRNLVIRDITRDGLATPRTRNGYAENIRVEGGPQQLTTCTLEDGGVTRGGSRRACEGRGGEWQDTAHRDGWQIGFRGENRSSDWVIRNVHIDGPMRGIAGNVDRVDLDGFSVRTNFAGAIQFTGTGPFRVRNGEVRVWTSPEPGARAGHTPRIIVGEPATVCGIRLYSGARQKFPPCKEGKGS